MTDAEENRWPVRKLAILFYPFSAAAVAINLFLLGLLWQNIGWPVVTPINAILWSVPLGIPATWWVAKWIRGLMDEADGV
ncbi:hypothetical protein SAMN05444000_112109 [Shimia gijangensis]|uniref:NnrT protein n=1 Tax=Shimia gijangensis TaxID=1470563 RepID=A0A1M6LUI4_9RHOB|nr:hypothetical protein [Shimia gijangensis]SHJ74840.1 hypothetical protein SAMN05444000_112109 [Shimia gijangensis]